MAQSLEYILHPGEVEMYVKCFEPTDIEELGSIRWFEAHDRLQKLHQQSILEAGSMREESVKEAFISLAKIPVLVQEAICVSVWKEKIFPELLKVDPLPKNTFMPYMVLYHEVTAVAQLETIMFHQDCCESLDDICIDLIDYCAFSVVSLTSLTDIFSANVKDITSRTTTEELQCQQKELAFDIGIRSISILSYIAQSLDRLPLFASTRLYDTHDVPMMFKNLLDTTPWIRENKKGNTLKYINGKWKNLGEERIKISKTEAQIWLCLRHMLLDPKCTTHYEFNEHRQTQLLKLQGRLHDALVDQLAPLIDLKHWLSRLALSSAPATSKSPIVIEIVPQIRKNILRGGKGKWETIVQKSINNFNKEKDQMMHVADRLKATFDVDTLEALAPDERSCSGCGEPATKRCSRCKTHWYCGRECQVKSWDIHKPICDKIMNSQDN